MKVTNGPANKEFKTDSKKNTDPRAAAQQKKTEYKSTEDAKKSLDIVRTEVARRNQPKVQDTKPAKIPQQQTLEEPAYVVAFETRELTEEEKAKSKGYSPEEVRAKAKAFLEMGAMPTEQREVLSNILVKEESQQTKSKK